MEKQPEKIYILHITDLHFGDHLDSPDILEKFYEKLIGFKTDHPNEVIHVAITGDFIDKYNSSKNAEIELFADFLHKIRDILGVTANHFIFCLGNHDKSKSQYSVLLESLKKIFGGTVLFSELTKEQMKLSKKQDYDDAVIEELVKTENHQIFIDPYAYLQSKYPSFRGKDCPLLGMRVINGIAYLVFNSSWLCMAPNGPDDGHLTLGIKITMDLLREYDALPKNSIFFTIGLMHHSFGSMHLSNFHQQGATNPISSEIFSRCDLILNGHEHGEIYPSMANISTYIFRAGSTLAKRDIKGYNSFSFIEINFLTRQVLKMPTYFDQTVNLWKELDPISLQFPNVARNIVLSHKIQINDYFNNVKSFIINQDLSGKYISAVDFLNGNFNADSAIKVICDIDSLIRAETLTEYMDLHSKVRSKVLLQLSSHAAGFTFIEGLELVTS